MLETIKALTTEYDMLPRGGTVLCAVSGGADSMCLLHLLHTWAGEGGFRVAAAHYNHNLRGPNPTGTPPLWRSGAPGRTSPASLARATWPMRPGPGAWGWRRPPARCAMNSCGGRRTPWAVDASPPPTAPTTTWKPCCSTWCGGRGFMAWRVSRPGGEWWCAPCSPPPGRRLWPTWRPTAWPTWRTAATPTRLRPQPHPPPGGAGAASAQSPPH